ncbi:MAG TPA: hypothetical protein PK156_43555 [Polyangium sp.]|nr:hypothetical protein [Polyangium sp.]
MKFASFALLAGLVCSSTSILACTYDLPEIELTSGSGGSAGETASSGNSSSSGQGGSNACTPGQTGTCNAYNGPPDTQNHGECKSSTRECLQSASWSACTMEVDPTPENCKESLDTNCDQMTGCTGALYRNIDIANTGSNRDDIILAMASKKGDYGYDGDVYLVGGKNFVNTPLVESSALVLQRNRDGQINDWSSKFSFMATSGSFGVIATSVAVLPTNGDVVVAGVFFGGTLQIGAKPMMTSATPNTFVARFTPSGDVVNAAHLGIGGTLITKTMVMDTAGKIYIGGEYNGSPQVLSTSLSATPTQFSDGFVICLSDNLNYAWHQTISGQGAQKVENLTTMNGTGLVAAISVAGDTSFLSTVDTRTFDAGLEPDLVVARLDNTNGKSMWDTRIGASTIVGSQIIGRLEAGGLAADTSKIVVGAKFAGNIDVNNAATYSNAEESTLDSLIVTLGPDKGALLKHYASQGAGSQEIQDINIDSFGDIVIAGSYSGGFPLDNGKLGEANVFDGFVAKITPDLQALWSQQLGTNDIQLVRTTHIGKSTGHVFVSGGFRVDFTLTNPPLMSIGGLDAFFVELAN